MQERGVLHGEQDRSWLASGQHSAIGTLLTHHSSRVPNVQEKGDLRHRAWMTYQVKGMRVVSLNGHACVDQTVVSHHIEVSEAAYCWRALCARRN